MSLTPKYVAAGFMEDARLLFTDFAKEPDKDFTTFAELWKKHKFTYIFLGRSDEKEFCFFVNEIYQLLLTYISSSSFDSQLSAIYLLYALFRNQDILPSIKIRVTQSQYRILKQIHLHAYEKKLIHLHYILDYLTEHAFIFPYHGSLYGPCSSKNSNDYITPKNHEFVDQSDLKQEMKQFYESGVLKDLKSLHLQYMKKKEAILPNKRDNKTTADVIKKYENFESALDCLVNNRRTDLNAVEESSGIGSRRMMLKNASYQKQARFRYLNPDDSSNESPEKSSISSLEPLKKKQLKTRRVPAHKRRVGRPRKNKPVDADDDESSKSEESDDTKLKIFPQTESPLKPKRGPIGRRNVSYLKNHDGPVPIEGPMKDSFVEELDDSSNGSFEDLVF